jgi:hypothetical protein
VPDPREVHRAGTALMSALMVAVGIAMLATTLAHGGGPLAIGVIMGVLFVIAGGGRLLLGRRAR